MILMGGPIDVRKNPTAVNEFAQSKSLEWSCKMVTMQVPPNYPGHGRKVYPGFLQLAGFMSLNLFRHIDSHLELWQSLLNSDYKKADHN
nr:Poly-beta-hydroxyalkanoate depolymerase [Rickettsia monacensis IrR/Munich]